MQTRIVLTVALVAAVVASSRALHAETAAESFAQGEAALAKADFATATQAYADAARADRNNAEYLQHYAMVRRVVDLRGAMPKESNAQRWEYMAKALRAFYTNERIYSELLKLDEQTHAKLSTPDSAAQLAETQLTLDQNQAAVKTLSGLEPAKTSEKAQALLGIALARTGQLEQAKAIARQLQLPDDATPGLRYAAARLHAATGDSAKAATMLKACFEATLPSQLDGFKTHAKACPEFAPIASSAEFVAVLETKSKLPESKCSGGGSCANCPMKGKCPMSQGK